MDRDLVERAQGGDRAAFAALASASMSRLDATARLITRDPERAKDAVQESLIRAWRDLPALRDPDRFDGWLRQILTRACIDELRRDRRHRLDVELTETHHPRVADSTISIEDRDALERGFRRLDPQQRTLVVLHYFEGLPLPEAAEAMRLPLGTAKSTLHRARARLRAALDADARTTNPVLEQVR